MADRFILCDGCSRHVKACEAACPFCGEGLAAARPSTGEPFRRMAAAAAVAAGVAAVTGCSSPSAVGFYGIANPVDAGQDQTDGGEVLPADSGRDAPSAVAFYGIANPIDASKG